MLFNKRLFPRKRINRIARLERISILAGQDEQSIEGEVMDLSRGGISLMVPENLPAGERYVVHFEIPFMGLEHKVAVVGILIYCVYIPDSVYKAGLQFKDLAPESAEAIDSFMAS
jgi:c-di-GMP-binding flagellar brake protein YcgR